MKHILDKLIFKFTTALKIASWISWCTNILTHIANISVTGLYTMLILVWEKITWNHTQSAINLKSWIFLCFFRDILLNSLFFFCQLTFSVSSFPNSETWSRYMGYDLFCRSWREKQFTLHLRLPKIKEDLIIIDKHQKDFLNVQLMYLKWLPNLHSFTFLIKLDVEVESGLRTCIKTEPRFWI